MSKTHIGLIGAGNAGRRHLRALASFDDVHIAAVCDTWQPHADEAAAAVGARAFDDYRRMLDSMVLDGVFVCAPPFVRADIEEALAERELAFFVEPPLDIDGTAHERTLKLVASRRVVTSVGYYWRYLAGIDDMCAQCADAKPVLLHGQRTDPLPLQRWKRRAELSGGYLLDATCEIFDMMRLIAGDAASITGAASTHPPDHDNDANIFDAAVCNIEFAGGAVGAVVAGCSAKLEAQHWLHIVCRRGSFHVDDSGIHRNGLPMVASGVAKSPLAKADRAFIDAINGKADDIRVTYADALASHHLVLSATEAVQRSQRILMLSPDAGFGTVPLQPLNPSR